MNVLHWGAKTQVSFKQNNWYDIATYRVKFAGKFNSHEIGRALTNRFNASNLSHLSVINIIQDGDEHVKVDVYYPIGD